MPDRHGVAVLSFTNVAAEEIRKRANNVGAPQLAEYPHFVGTFDGFVARYLVAPFGHRWGAPDKAVRVVESWATLDAMVRLGSGPGVSLDAFERDECGAMQLNMNMVPWELKKVVGTNVRGWTDAALDVWKRLQGAGYMSCRDARVCATQRLRDPKRGPSILKALASRFQLLVVDEAQDSNPTDLEIVEALATAGIRTVIVADRDQSIFGFRKASTAGLSETAARRRMLRLTGNFRSTPDICRATSTFKRTPLVDVSLGTAAALAGRVLVFAVAGSADVRVGSRFVQELQSMSLGADRSAVLAYVEDVALRAAGLPVASKGTKSALERLAVAVSAFRRPDLDGGRRLRALAEAEDLLIRRMGLNLDNTRARDVAATQGFGEWLRQTSLQLLGVLAARPVADDGVRPWLEYARSAVGSVVPPPGRAFTRTPAQVLRNCGWAPAAETEGAALGLLASTIHRAKGREFDGVLVVMSDAKLSETFDAWDQRTDDESRRVYYVGVTRARQLLAIAVPTAYAARAVMLLSRDGAPVKRVDIA